MAVTAADPLDYGRMPDSIEIAGAATAVQAYSHQRIPFVLTPVLTVSGPFFVNAQ